MLITGTSAWEMDRYKASVKRVLKIKLEMQDMNVECSSAGREGKVPGGGKEGR